MSMVEPKASVRDNNAWKVFLESFVHIYFFGSFAIRPSVRDLGIRRCQCPMEDAVVSTQSLYVNGQLCS